MRSMLYFGRVGLELAAIAAILLTSSVQIAAILVVLSRMRDKMEADDAALYLQGKRVEEVVREMRAELVRR